MQETITYRGPVEVGAVARWDRLAAILADFWDAATDQAGLDPALEPEYVALRTAEDAGTDLANLRGDVIHLARALMGRLPSGTNYDLLCLWRAEILGLSRQAGL